MALPAQERKIFIKVVATYYQLAMNGPFFDAKTRAPYKPNKNGGLHRAFLSMQDGSDWDCNRQTISCVTFASQLYTTLHAD
jgi:hypothetical protein